MQEKPLEIETKEPLDEKDALMGRLAAKIVKLEMKIDSLTLALQKMSRESLSLKEKIEEMEKKNEGS